MAVYYQARQRQSDKRWDFTNSSDDEGWCYPVGYCAGWKDWTQEMADRIGMSLEKLQKDQTEKSGPFKDKYHTDGHATAAEAHDCYLQYELDQEFRVGETRDTQHKCHVCGAWTQKLVEVGRFKRWHLCDAHANRDTVEGLCK